MSSFCSFSPNDIARFLKWYSGEQAFDVAADKLISWLELDSLGDSKFADFFM